MSLTIGIATCGRPRILRRCIDSINRFTKTPVEFIVVDNTGAFTDDPKAKASIKGVNIIDVSDKKIGCCESNNIIADECKTKYLMHMDDDVYIPSNSDGVIDDMYKLISIQDEPTIIGGCWYDTFYMDMRHAQLKLVKAGNTIRPNPLPYRKFTGLTETDICLHSMIMDKDKVYSRVRWDENFKWKGDREDFFLQCKQEGIKLYSYGDKDFIHDPHPFKYGSLSYEDYGGKEAIEYFERKWGLKPLVGWDTHQYKPGNL